MSLVTGNYFDIGAHGMGNWHGTVTFELSAPATEMRDAQMLVSSANKRSVSVDPVTGAWSMFLAATEGMAQDRYYTVTGTALDADGGFTKVDYFPWQIRVPEGTWKFTDLVRDWSSPLAVGISTTPPALLPAFWLDPITGNFSRKTA